jgi:hypothetical protein
MRRGDGMPKDNLKVGSGGLLPSRLSDPELEVMLKIEQHLRDLGKRPPPPKEEVWQIAEKREDRVILLDGDRGAGKTSLMWAMIERWGDSFSTCGLADAYQERAATPEMADHREALVTPPTNVRVLGILDFDPLPPSMPVVAGLVQSWRRLADKLSRGMIYEDIDNDDSIMDSWQRLFRKAAAGWGKLGERKTLIDQVLDQEEQIQDWQTLGLEWRAFVEKIIGAGSGEPYHLDKNTAFVIMIDDCDLQVERMREILPAIRLLYDHNVFFIVAADHSHMLDMLELDYLGQQNIMANRQIRKNPLADEDRWAKALAKASFEKVFPTVLRHRLPRLSLKEILEYPLNSEDKGDKKNLAGVLKHWQWNSNSGNARYEEGILPETPKNLADYLTAMADVVEKSPVHFPLATYRTTQQSWESICQEPKPETRARQAVARILGGAEYDELIETVGVGKTASASRGINFRARGRLVARFYEQFSVPVGSDYRIDLSAAPEFEVLPPTSRTAGLADGVAGNRRPEPTQAAAARQNQAILAVSLQEDSYNVQTPHMKWQMERALVWTFHYRPYFMNFSWPALIHPSPLRLMSWAREWDTVINTIRRLPLPDRAWMLAYAWIGYQLKWTGVVKTKPNLSKKPTLGDFDALISKSKPLAWVPLARPEIGLPLELQRWLLKDVPPARRNEFRQERRQKITDALIAGGEALLADQAQGAARVTQIEDQFEKLLDLEGHSSPWAEKIELTELKTSAVIDG